MNALYAIQCLSDCHWFPTSNGTSLRNKENRDYCWNIFCNNRSRGNCWVTTMTLDNNMEKWPWILLLHFSFLLNKSYLSPQCLCAVVINESTCLRHYQCSGVNIIGISVYSIEYTCGVVLYYNFMTEMRKTSNTFTLYCQLAGKMLKPGTFRLRGMSAKTYLNESQV